MLSNGQKVGERYEIVKSIGEGGMAIVYLADDLITRKEVAVKIIKEDTMKNPVNLTRFEREKSIRRYLAPKGTEAIERFAVSSFNKLSFAFA